MKKLIIIQIVFFTFILFGFQCQGANIHEHEFSPFETANNNNIDNSYDKLLSYGYPEEIIKNFSKTAIDNILLTLDNHVVTDVSWETEIAPKIKPENNDIVITYISAELKEKISNKIIGESICIYWEWVESPPLIQDEDYISVKWNKDVLCLMPNSFYAEDYSKNNPADNWDVSRTYTVLAHSSSNDLGHWTEPKIFKNCIGGVMIFNLLTVSQMDTNTEIDSKLYIEYSQQTDLLHTAFVLSPFVILPATVTIFLYLKKRKRHHK